MSAEAQALLRLKLLGADEVLASIRQVAAEVRNLGGGQGPTSGVPTSGGMGVPPSGQNVAQPSMPATGVSASAGAGAGPGVAAAVAGVSVQGGNAAAVAMSAAMAAPATPTYAYFNRQTGAVHGLSIDPIANRYVDAVTGAMMLGPRPLGATGSTPRGPVNTTWRDLGMALGGMQALHQASQLGSAWAGGLGESAATGRPFRPESLAPSAVGLAGLVAGAAIGSVIPGIGTAVGAIVGGTLGSIGGSYLQPIVDRNVRQSHLSDMLDAYGLGRPRGAMTMRGIGLAEQALAEGKFEAARLSERLVSTNEEFEAVPFGPARRVPAVRRLFTGDPEKRGAVDAAVEEIGRLMFDPSVLAAFGGRTPDPTNPEDLEKMISIGAASGNLSGRRLDSALLDPGDSRMRKAFDKATGERELARRTQVMSEARSKVLGARERLASVDLMIAEQTGGSGEVRRRASELSGIMRGQAAERRALAAAKTQDPFARAELLAEAEAIERTAGFAERTAAMGAEDREIRARAGSRTGIASRAFEVALYGGSRASALPWEGQRRALTAEANEEAAFVARHRNELSPAEREERMERVRDLRHRASVELPRQREQAEIRADFAEAGLSRATRARGYAPAIAYGSAASSAEAGYRQRLEDLREEAALIERTLATRRLLTDEERKQLQTRRETLEATRPLLEAERTRAVLSARSATEMHGIEMGRTGDQISLIRGAGGEEATRAMSRLVASTETALSAKRAELGDLFLAGFDPNSEAVMDVQRQLKDLTMDREMQQRGMAVAPVSGADRARFSTLRTRRAFYEAGYGSTAQGVRATYEEELRGVRKLIGEQTAHRRTMMDEGRWTEAMEADHTERLDELRLQGLEAQTRLDQGWDQRLISQAYNMPSTGRLNLSRFTRTNAAILGGIAHRAFGGTEEQTRGFRETSLSMGDLGRGSGSASNFADRALGGSSEMRLQIEVTVRDEEGRAIGDVRKRAQLMLDQFSGVSVVEGNPSEKRKPTG